jgi:hypothetical protein
MAKIKVNFISRSGAKRLLFRNVRLAGSWDGNGQFSNQWTQGPGLYLPDGLHQQRK